jgi:hypothetical protein
MIEDAGLLSFCQVGLHRWCRQKQYRVAKYENLDKINAPALVAFDRVNDFVCME